LNLNLYLYPKCERYCRDESFKFKFTVRFKSHLRRCRNQTGPVLKEHCQWHAELTLNSNTYIQEIQVVAQYEKRYFCGSVSADTICRYFQGPTETQMHSRPGRYDTASSANHRVRPSVTARGTAGRRLGGSNGRCHWQWSSASPPSQHLCDAQVGTETLPSQHP